MPTDIIVALIALLGVIVTSVASVRVQKVNARKAREETIDAVKQQSELADQKLDAKLERHQAITDIKIEELTREVRAHNNFAQRMPVVEEQIKVINHRIEDLEHKS